MNDSQSRDELLAAAERRGNTYKLLAECYHPPDDELGALLGEVAGETPLEVQVDAIADRVPEDTETLRVDYAKLFVGPFEVLAPPYGSVYLEDEGRVMTDSTLDVQYQFRTEGLDVGLDEPADHVAAELEFVYFLVTKEAEAIGEGDLETAREYLQKQTTFLENHLGRWVGEFADDVEAHAETPFYRELARQTASFVESDVETMADRVDRFEAEPIGENAVRRADET